MRIDAFRNAEAAIAERLSTATYCKIVNQHNRLRGKAHQIAPAVGEPEALHVVSDADGQIVICRRGRHNRYKRGIMAGVDRLAADYHLNRIADLQGGLFIDCGANVGELGLWARARGHRYIAFEPEAYEARCCDLNNFGGEAKTLRKALWHEETVLRFYNRAESADSSVLASDGPESFVEIPATTLDAAVSFEGVTGPVIFKLEAEGAEPEVLEGARKSLERIDWVAVDCGYERGPQKAHTFVETNTFLQDHGFRLEAAQFRRVTALYRNTRR
ncbi:MAG: FkbM family methyltransferase [Paracoccaceae bacterium]